MKLWTVTGSLWHRMSWAPGQAESIQSSCLLCVKCIKINTSYVELVLLVVNSFFLGGVCRHCWSCQTGEVGCEELELLIGKHLSRGAVLY